MSMAIAEGNVPDVQTQAHDLTKRRMQQWFDWMDGILDIHRGNFVFRQPAPAQLDEHKPALKLAIRYCLRIYPLIADLEFNEPDSVSRLQVRIGDCHQGGQVVSNIKDVTGVAPAYGEVAGFRPP